MRRRIGSQRIFAACFVALLVGCSPAVEAAGPVVLPEAAKELSDAKVAAPFELRLPGTVPDGYTLARVSWVDSGDAADDGFSIGVDYLGPDGQYYHVWQTNVSAGAMAGTDPVAQNGATMTVAGVDWVTVPLPVLGGVERFQFATRFADGVTVTMDGPSVQGLEQMAESLSIGRSD